MLKKNLQGGFTTIELLISIGLFGLIAPSITLAIVSINRINDRASDLTYANVIAENKIETLRSAGYNSLVNGTIVFTGELPATFTEPKLANYIITTPSAGKKEILINIQYNDQGIARSLSYKSIISELGVAQ